MKSKKYVRRGALCLAVLLAAQSNLASLALGQQRAKTGGVGGILRDVHLLNQDEENMNGKTVLEDDSLYLVYDYNYKEDVENASPSEAQKPAPEVNVGAGSVAPEVIVPGNPPSDEVPEKTPGNGNGNTGEGNEGELPGAGDNGGTSGEGGDSGTPEAGEDSGTPEAGEDSGTPEAGGDSGTPEAGGDSGTPEAGEDSGTPEADGNSSASDAGDGSDISSAGSKKDGPVASIVKREVRLVGDSEVEEEGSCRIQLPQELPLDESREIEVLDEEGEGSGTWITDPEDNTVTVFFYMGGKGTIRIPVVLDGSALGQEADSEESSMPEGLAINDLQEGEHGEAAGIEDESHKNPMGDDAILIDVPLDGEKSKRITLMGQTRERGTLPEGFFTAVELTDEKGELDTNIPYDKTVTIKMTYTMPENATEAIKVGTEYPIKLPDIFDLTKFDKAYVRWSDDSNVILADIEKDQRAGNENTLLLKYRNSAAEKGHIAEQEEGVIEVSCGFYKDEIQNGGKKEINFSDSVFVGISPYEVSFAIVNIEGKIAVRYTKGEASADTGGVIEWEAAVEPSLQNAYKDADKNIKDFVINCDFTSTPNHSMESPIVNQIEIKDESGADVTNQFYIEEKADSSTGKVTGFKLTYTGSSSSATSAELSLENLSKTYTISYSTQYGVDAWIDPDYGKEVPKFSCRITGEFIHKGYDESAEGEDMTGVDSKYPNPVGEDDKISDKAEKEVTISTRFLVKGAEVDYINQVIHWNVTINEKGMPLGNNVTLVDTISIKEFPDQAPRYVADSFKLSTDKEHTNEYDKNKYKIDTSFEGKANKFKLSFTDQLSQTLYLSYDTEIDSDFIFNNQNVTFVNKVYLIGDGTNIGKPYTTEGKLGGHILTKSGEYDRSSHTITWKVKYKDWLNGTTASIKDTIPSGLTYVSGSFKATGDSLNGTVTPTFTGPDSTGSSCIQAELKLNQAGSGTEPEEVVITFDTTVDDPQYWAVNSGKRPFTNNVSVTAVGLTGDSGGTPNTTSASTNVDVISEVLKKSGMGYDVPAKEIQWKLDINQNKMVMTNPVITDILPEGTELVMDGNGAIPGTFEGAADIISNFNYDQATRQLTINLEDQARNAGMKTLTYKTRVTDMDLLYRNSKGNVKNTAILRCEEMGKDSTGADVTVSSTASIDVGVSVLEKTGKQGADIEGYTVLDWTVAFNKNGIPIDSPVVTDKLPGGLELRESSLGVYRVTLDAQGKVTHKEAVPLGTAEGRYAYTYQDNTLTVSINGAINDPYQIEFATYFETSGFYNNSVSLTGVGFVPENASSGEVRAEAIGGGTGTGGRGSITVIKTDDKNNPLPGAEFSVNSKIQTTGADGKAVFDNLRKDTYEIKELSAPEGYIIGNGIPDVVVKAAEMNPTCTVINNRIYGSLEIEKLDDQTHTPLPGAVLGLYTKEPDGSYKLYQPEDGGEFENPQTTDSSGNVLFDPIPYGDYYYHEDSAPGDYVGDDNYYPVDIRENHKRITLKFGNGHAAASLEIQKVEAETGTALSGAEFTVYRSSDNQSVVSGITGADGIVSFHNLLTGVDYYYKETKVPDGYKGDTDKQYPIRLTTHGESAAVTIENQKIITNEGGDGNIGGSIGGNGSGGGSGGSSSSGSRPGAGNAQGGASAHSGPGADPVTEASAVPAAADITIHVEPGDNGGNTAVVPAASNTETIIVDTNGQVVHRGRTDADGKFHFNLPAGSYVLYTVDEMGTPMAQYPFRVLGAEDYIEGLPKTGDDTSQRAYVLLLRISSALLLILATGGFGIFRKKER